MNQHNTSSTFSQLDFFPVLEHSQDAILITDGKSIEYANHAAEKLFDSSSKELTAYPLDTYLDQFDSSTDGKQQVNICTPSGALEVQLHCNKITNQDKFILMLKNKNAALFSELDESDKRILHHTEHLKLLHELTTKTFNDFSEVLHNYILTGLRIFNLETGIISKITGDNYKILAAISPDHNLRPDVEYPLENTYSQAVVEQKKTITYFNVGAMEDMREHPMYKAHKLEAYMGCPILVNNKIYGTLVLSSHTPHEEDFDWLDIEIIEMMAQTLGKIIESRESELAQAKLQNKLQESKNEFEETLNSVHDCVIRVNEYMQFQFANPSAKGLLNYGEKYTEQIHIDEIIKLTINDRDTQLSHLVQQSINNKSNLVFSSFVKLTNMKKQHFDIELGITPLFHEDGESNGAVINIDDITKLQEMARELKFQATHDALTGLPNRLLFDDHAQRAAHRCERYGGEFAIIFCDLNGFKAINDTLGHQIGDDLLIEVAKRLRKVTRKTDVISRFGGDEFVILATDLKATFPIDIITNKVEEVFEKAFILDREEYVVKTSLGTAVYPHDGDDVESLMRVADMRMYEDKKTKKQQSV